MKVLFSNPPWWEGQEGTPPRRYWRAGVRAGSRWPFTLLVAASPDRFKPGGYLPYPFFMGYATTYLQRATEADVHFRDSIALRESYDRYFANVASERYDFIFIESATPSWHNDRQVIDELARRSPATKIVVTGPITSTKAEGILANHPVYACIRGEYEKGCVRVVNGESGIIDHDLLTKDEMNAAPFPYYDHVVARRYWDCNPRGQRRPQAQVWSSRGCPYKCIFCVWPATMTGNDPDGKGRRMVRQYTPEYVEAFLTELVERYHYKSVYFDDDTFNLGDRHVLAMCEVMTRVGLPWACMCRADTIKLETWTVMRDSGCVGVKIGFESGNQHVVDDIVNKRLDLERGAEVVHELNRLGMSVHGTFTYGLPGETKEQMLDTKRFIERLPFDSVQESGAAEIEGTPLHTLRQQGRLEKYQGARLDEDYAVMADGSKKGDRMRAELGR